MTTNHLLRYSSDPLGRIPFDCRECCTELWDMTLTSSTSKADLLIADALSRSHTTNQTRSQREEEIETIGLVIQDQSMTSHLKEIAEETAKDNVLQSVIHHISENWFICKRRLPMDVHPFWSCKDQLSFSDGIVYRGDRIVVPATLRKSLTEKLHQAHMGVESSLRRARTSLWWPV